MFPFDSLLLRDQDLGSHVDDLYYNTFYKLCSDI
jgi:hypothetical protein